MTTSTQTVTQIAQDPNMLTVADVVAIRQEALDAAKRAAEQHLDTVGENMYCGFAWVDVSVERTNSKEAKALESIGFRKSYRPKMMTLWDPAGHRGQSMDCKEVGAQAYADVLRAHGYKAYMGSRAD